MCFTFVSHLLTFFAHMCKICEQMYNKCVSHFISIRTFVVLFGNFDIFYCTFVNFRSKCVEMCSLTTQTSFPYARICWVNMSECAFFVQICRMWLANVSITKTCVSGLSAHLEYCWHNVTGCALKLWKMSENYTEFVIRIIVWSECAHIRPTHVKRMWANLKQMWNTFF